MTEMERIIQDIRILARWDHIPTVVKKAIIQSKKREEIERSKKRVEEDKFNLPSHYDFPELKQSTMEIINIVAEANSGGVFQIGWYLANALKYLFRFRRKNGVADLEKARDYINRLIAYFVSEGGR